MENENENEKQENNLNVREIKMTYEEFITEGIKITLDGKENFVYLQNSDYDFSD